MWLDETFTLLFRRLAVHKAKASLDFLVTAVEDGSVALATVNAGRFREAVRVRLKYKDRPEISFTSMVVMQELELKRILTEDRHFAQVGLGFELLP
jgi:predicted nucleic acid-binding protein